MIFFFPPARAKATSKQICVKSVFHRVAFKEGRRRTSRRFVCLFNSSASRLPSSSCEQAETHYNFAYNVAGMQRIPSVHCTVQQSAFMWLLAAGRQSARVKVEARTPNSFFKIIIYSFLSPLTLPKAVCGCCFGGYIHTATRH